MSYRSGRHFLQLPGPTNVPTRVLRAMDRPVVDHRGPDFARLTKALLRDLASLLGTEHPVFIYPASGTGAWEAAITNTLSPGDRVVFFDHGHFARKWAEVAEAFGLDVELRDGDWRFPVGSDDVEALLRKDESRSVRAVMIEHNETSTGVVTDIAAVRAAMDRADHPALLMVDTVSSLGSMEYRHDEWGVDVTVAASQKGLMLPPGLSFNAVSPKALDASAEAQLPCAYWRWDDMLDWNARGFFPATPATSLLFGLEEALAMIAEEGLSNVFARHERHAQATRRAVSGWDLETVCADPAAVSASVTAIYTPIGHDADRLRAVVLDRFDMSLGKGLGELEGFAFRIGHMGDFNDLMLAGTLAGVEMGLAIAGVPFSAGGVQDALDFLAKATAPVAEGAP